MQAKKNYTIKIVKTLSLATFIMIGQLVMAQNKTIHLKFNNQDLKDYTIEDGKKLHFIDVYGNKISKNIKIISDTSFVVLNFFLEAEDTLTISEISYIRNRSLSRKHFRRMCIYGIIPYVNIFVAPVQLYKFLTVKRYYSIETVKIKLIENTPSN